MASSVGGMGQLVAKEEQPGLKGSLATALPKCIMKKWGCFGDFFVFFVGAS